MKHLMKISFWVAVLVSTRSYAQQQETVLTAYLTLKDALVASDATLAAADASNLTKQLTLMSTGKSKKTLALIDKVKDNAEKISSTKVLATQREAFTPLSENFVALAKEISLSRSPLYQFYCPMKKAVWLSAEKAVKNPYYGNQMLTCGSLQETLE